MHIKHDEAQEHEFQIAPMVDVVFMLIIFFMLSAAMSLKGKEEDLEMVLPGPHGPDNQVPPIELTIRDDGAVLFNELEVGKPNDSGLRELQTRLERAIQLFGDNQPVILSPAPSIPHRRVVEVVDCCATAQVRALSFAH